MGVTTYCTISQECLGFSEDEDFMFYQIEFTISLPSSDLFISMNIA